jgi:IS5 family transposase
MKMLIQQSLGDMEYANKRRKTRKEMFLDRMEGLIPWVAIVGIIEPIYPKAGPKGGRPPIGIEKMLRMLLVSNWFNLSDEGCEDAVTENQTIRRFVRVNLSHEDAPDATTLLRFRHLLEANGVYEQIFETINRLLIANGLTVSKGSIVDASIITAPSSTKNASNARDPEMHSTKMGNQWYFGMKAHIGIDDETGITHTLITTSANTHDITEAHRLIRGGDDVVRGDAGYIGLNKRPEIERVGKSDMVFEISKRIGTIRNMVEGSPERIAEYFKASIRAKVERAFLFVKYTFGYRKTRYRGLAKNRSRLFLLFASANLLIAAERGKYCYGT